VIAERDGVGARGKKLFIDRLRDAEALVGGVLAVDDSKLDLPLRDTIRKVSADRFAARLSDDIADKQNAQDRLLSCRRLPTLDSVRTLTNALNERGHLKNWGREGPKASNNFIEGIETEARLRRARSS
jgi:hypothetical protein